MSVHHHHSRYDMFLPLDDFLYPTTQHAAPAAPSAATVPYHHPPHQQQVVQAQPAAQPAQPAAQDFNVGDANNPRSSFPERLHGLIMDAETMGFQNVVSWQDSGNSFKVHKPQIFQKDIIPKYFKPIKYTSFQRQLSIYGFQRIRTGWNTGGYEHPCFTREDSSMCKHIRRHQNPTAFAVKPTAVAPAPAIPSFVPITESKLPVTSIDEDLFKMYGDMDPIDAALAQMKNEATTITVCSSSASTASANMGHHDFEPLPLGSTCLPRVSSYDNNIHHHHGQHGQHGQQNHQHQNQQHDDHFIFEKLHSSFRDDIHYGGIIENPFKTAEARQQDIAASTSQQQQTSSNKGAFFPAKLHQLLEDAERLNFRHIVSWTDNGRAFQIHDQKEFVSKIMNIYFDQSKFASFRRQLNLYGFNRTRTNNNKNMYFHENFVEGDPKQCEQMFRRCSSGAAKPIRATSFAA